MTSFLKMLGTSFGGKKGKWITLGSWIILVVLVNVVFPQAASQKNDAAKNLLSKNPSVQAEKLVKKEFPSGTGVPALITWYRQSGLTTDDLMKIQSFSKAISEHRLPNQVGQVPLYQMPVQALKAQVSSDGTTLVQPIFFKNDADATQLKKSLTELENTVTKKFGNNPFNIKMKNDKLLLARVTGPVGIQVDATALFGSADVSLLLTTVSLVLIFLLLIYRSPILALIPLIAVGFAYAVVNPILGQMASAGLITFDSQSLSIMTVLLFGAGTDYCLFLIARFRSNLKEEENKTKALIRAFSGTAGAISMSGLTVVISLLVLLLAEYGSIQRFAVPFSLSILMMMIASLTLVPALLGILGRVSFFPFIPRTEGMELRRAEKKGKPVLASKTKRGLGEKLGEGIIKKPWVVVGITIVILGIFALLSSQIKYTFDTLSSFPKNMPSREGFSLISDHFSPGELAPTQVVVQSEGNNLNIKEKLQSLSFVSKVSEPQKGKNDHNLLKYDVELSMNPYSNEAMGYIPDLRSQVETILHQNHITNVKNKVWIGGQTATQFDTKKTTNADAFRVIPIIIVLIAILLLVYLRSITAMVYLMATVLLSYFSALGLGWMILHYLLGTDAIQGLIPLYAFVFIVALGEDYNIFMVSSIWKKRKAMPLAQAVKEGISQTSSVITSAGVILAGTFAVLTTLPIQVLVQFGTVTAIGVLLDTFIVRPFLVPALTVLFGKWAFWPAK